MVVCPAGPVHGSGSWLTNRLAGDRVGDHVPQVRQLMEIRVILPPRVSSLVVGQQLSKPKPLVVIGQVQYLAEMGVDRIVAVEKALEQIRSCLSA